MFSKDVIPACLYTTPNDIDEQLFVTGWGVFELKTRGTSTYLLRGALSYTPLNDCNNLFQEVINSQLPDGIKKGQLCAVDKREVEVKIDACQGDSGKLHVCLNSFPLIYSSYSRWTIKSENNRHKLCGRSHFIWNCMWFGFTWSLHTCFRIFGFHRTYSMAWCCNCLRKYFKNIL